jgi:hypothetical protein
MMNYLKISMLMITTLLSFHAQCGPFLAGEYISLDGQYKHNFKATGDYWGSATYSGKEHSGSGLYEQGSDICWIENKDGSKGAAGNIVFYVGEVQCCLQFRQISDKYAVSKIWVKGTGVGYALCQNQVLRKKN